MRGRWGAALVLAAALTIAGPGLTALHAGEAPSDRGPPSEDESPGSRAPETPPGQQSEDPSEPAQGSGPRTEEPDSGSGAPATDGPSTGGDGTPPGGGAPVPEAPPPPPQPDLTGTRVLRSSLGLAQPRADGAALRDLRVLVTETGAAGIDGGWWVVVTAPAGELRVAQPSLHTTGDGGVPRTPDGASRGGGPLFWIAGQRSAERYHGLYEATGTVALPREGEPERPVVTVLLIQ